MYVRAQLRINSTKDAEKLVSILNRDGTTDKYILENYNGEYRVSARSLLGVIYLGGDCDGDVFLVNTTRDGIFPSDINPFRPTGSFD